MTPEEIAWFESLESHVFRDARARVTFRHGSLFAIEVWDENMNYYIIRQGEETTSD